MLLAGTASAATPSYYASQAAYEAVLAASIIDDYSSPGYAFIQNNATMSAVVGQTDYASTGFADLNIVSGGVYCAGCNGSFELSFQTTSIGTAQGVGGVGVYIPFNDAGTPYFAYITFADGDIENVALPPAGSYWAVTAPERIERIHFGLSGGVATTSGSFGIDNLEIGELPGSLETCDGAPLDVSALTPGSGATVSVLGDTTGAADDIFEAGQIACWSGSEAVEHVYEFSLGQATYLQIDLEGSSYDTKLAVVSACPAGNAFCLYNDDFSGLASGFVCSQYAAGTYSTIVSGYNGGFGAYSLNLTECRCGNLLVDGGEGCDEGGQTATCDADCSAVFCGDGHANAAAGESCDTGGASASCDADCTAPVCGDGVANAAFGESCDPGGQTAACDADCTTATCGDGYVNAAAGEACDAGGNSAACDSDCSTASCGDGFVNAVAGETCDDGGRSPECNSDCTTATCGDGIVNGSAGEECDGNGAGTPGATASCDADCTNAMCGDMVVNAAAGEECDDGGESTECNADCTAASCGDGVVNEHLGEECDDDNNTDGDGCSADCDVEDEPGTSSEGGSSEGGDASTGGDETTDGGSVDTSGTGGSASASASGSASLTAGESDGSGESAAEGIEGSGSGADTPSLDPTGCACTTDSDADPTWSFLAWLGVGALARRRRR